MGIYCMNHPSIDYTIYLHSVEDTTEANQVYHQFITVSSHLVEGALH